MSKVLVSEENLTGIADAIREKNGSQETYTPSEMATAISNISGGGSGGKNVQCDMGHYGKDQASYQDIGLSLTVAKTGLYTVKWIARRESTAGTWGTALYINGSLYGSVNEEWEGKYFYNNLEYDSTSYLAYQRNELNNVSLTEGDTVKIYAKTRGNTFIVWVDALSIEEE